MSEKIFDLNRRKFMVVSSAAIAAPFVMKMTGLVRTAGAAEKEVDTKYAGIKSIVIYYSMTGNTKKIAQGLQNGIIKRTGQCDIVRLKDAKTLDLANYDLIGIGCPVYGQQICPHYLDFVTKRMSSNVKGKHAFFYATHGTLPGRVVLDGVEGLQKAGMIVIGWKDWFAGCTYLPGHAMPWITDGHPDAIDMAEAEAFGTAMAEHSRKVSDGWTERIPKLPSREVIDAIYGVGIGGETEAQPNTASSSQLQEFLNTSRKIDQGKCIACGRCAKACYFEVIDASAKPVVVKRPGDCVNCGFCSGVCPTGAISGGDFIGELFAGKSNLLASMNAGAPNGASYNPNRDDGRAKGGDFQEATGHLRKLVREEDMNWNITYAEAVGKPPRFKEIP